MTSAGTEAKIERFAEVVELGSDGCGAGLVREVEREVEIVRMLRSLAVVLGPSDPTRARAWRRLRVTL